MDVQVFPVVCRTRLCAHLLVHLRRLLRPAVRSQRWPFPAPALSTRLLRSDTEGDALNNPLRYKSTSTRRTDRAKLWVLQILKETLCSLCFLPQVHHEETFSPCFRHHFSAAPSQAETHQRKKYHTALHPLQHPDKTSRRPLLILQQAKPIYDFNKMPVCCG